jgi:hypothetical protein
MVGIVVPFLMVGIVVPPHPPASSVGLAAAALPLRNNQPQLE